MDTSKYYKLVHMGGHHEVFCNGREHIRLSGWRYGECSSKKDNTATIEKTSCDCEQWRDGR